MTDATSAKPTMEQLIFELAPAEPPRLSNFLPGRNAELVALLPRFVAGDIDETGLLLWGEAGAGKTHLLHAAIETARQQGIAARWVADPRELDSTTGDAVAMVVIDRIDTADAAATATIFTLYNAQKQRGGRLIAASRTPLALLPLREDLRTRLGWGLVYEVLPLSDADKPAAMVAFADQRGFHLSAEVIDYLLHHGRRDLPSLLATLAALDRASLASKRTITVPLLKAWLKRVDA
ncbi:MAG TPA: DnaA regulatory inactivator Hda [Casimicrobiaceae bacterium]|jgi:DnaA family protein|nr:DnaA regulatory inactivator Hda [Casimicrobiaceae bacterium]